MARFLVEQFPACQDADALAAATPRRHAAASGAKGDAGVIGTAKLGFCLLTSCTAYVDTTNFNQGTDHFTATYGGDLGSNSSTVTSTVTVTTDLSGYSNTSSVVCLKGSRSCDAGLITDGGGTWLDTNTDDSVGSTANHTLAEQVGPGTLGCASTASGGAGALATFTDTPVVSSFKQALYTITNSLKAANLRAAFAAHPSYLGCYASDTPFIDGSTGLTAVQNPADGNLYEGPIPSCGSVSSNEVCFVEYEDFDQIGNPAPGDVQVDIRWGVGTAGDPKYIG